MAVWSSLAFKNIGKNVDIARRVFGSFGNMPKTKAITYIPVRNSHDRTMEIRSSTFEWFKFKDLFILYAIIGAIPYFSIMLYANIFIGPATLALIPEGYDPKPWEYHRVRGAIAPVINIDCYQVELPSLKHPITRFFAKYVTPSPQEEYERTLHNIFVNNEIRMLNDLEVKVQNLIKQRSDYQSWYYEKPSAKYVRRWKERGIEAEARSGITTTGWVGTSS